MRRVAHTVLRFLDHTTNRFRLPVSSRNLVAALLAGLVLRLIFVIHFPFAAGDTKFYDALARNWLDHHVYGFFVNGRLAASDMRVPGYSAFLAAIYALFGRAPRAVLLAQTVIDLVTCIVISLIAARLAPPERRSIAATAALWLAALCPFTANYSAVLLTESLSIFFTSLALLVFVAASEHVFLRLRNSNEAALSFTGWVFVGAVLVALGTLVRPETPLVLLAAGLIFAIRFRHRANWRKMILAASWMTAGLLLPLLPWAARNARTMGRIEFLAPRYAETEGDFIPRGLFAWTQTWMTQESDAWLLPWRLGKEPIAVNDLPASAFDSPAEHQRVENLFMRYSSNLEMSPVLDREFAEIARERTAREPLRTYVGVPAIRIWEMWFTPRVEFLRYSGQITPINERWRDNRSDLVITLIFTAINILYITLALAGVWLCRRQAAILLLLTYIAVRTIFLTQMQTVEPRYVIECVPLLLAIGAQTVTPLLQWVSAVFAQRRWSTSAVAAD
jgi:hypothetical protein